MKEDKVYLQDILNSINKINNYILDMSIGEFKSDYKTQDAIIRNFTIIGEATNRLSIEFEKSHKEFPFKEAIGMRNVLVHNYDQIDIEKTWNTIKKDLPKLKNIVNGLI